MTISHVQMQKLLGEYLLMIQDNIKPNYSQIARETGVDRHTVAKYFKNGFKTAKEPKKRECKLDRFKEEIETKILNTPPTTKTALFNYFKNKYPEDFTSYSTFKQYVTKHKMISKKPETPKLRYEADPGESLQVDWKEEMKMTLKTGEVITFNVFGATLSHSRYHMFIYSPGKTQQDFIRCTIEALRTIGGTPKEILTDNMAAICNHSTHKLLPRVEQFGKDIGVNIKRCKVRHPYTKGKVESANRFLEWLKPYENELECEEDLIKAIETIQNQANSEVNKTTGVPPMVLLKKELEYLSPLPNESLLNEYHNEAGYKIVPCTLLIRHNGAEYSVPPEFIGKKVTVTESANKLLIKYNTNTIAVHEIGPKNSIQYNRDHYANATYANLSKNHEADEINNMVDENLRKLQWIGGSNE